jgi:Copper transport outer membrane protein, MctB
LLDYRYHALSLAAVLLALAVGVLIGVAIGDSNLVSSAKSGIVHDLSSEVSSAQRRTGVVQAKLAGEETFANDLYPIAVHGLLTGHNVGLVFLGGASDQMNGLVRNAVTQAGGELATVVAVRTPLDLTGLGREAAGTRYAVLGTEPTKADLKLVERFGVIVGKQLVSGGQAVPRELISRVRGRLLTAFDGQLGRLEGLVVARADPPGMTPEQVQVSTAFDSGLIDGVQQAGLPTVGVELTKSQPSQVPWYQAQDVSSVDDLDSTAGQAALIYALIGSHGSYGIKPTADSLLPNLAGSTAQP